MSRFERVLWGVFYFGVMVAVFALLTAYAPFHAPFNILATAVVMFMISAWRRFRQRIIRDLGWGLRTVWMRLRIVINPLVARFVTRKMVVRHAHGLVVLDFDNSDGTRARRCERVVIAIDRIQQLWPSRYARLQRLHPRILIGDFRMIGGFVPGTDVIIVHPALIDLWQPESVACVLCHELHHYFILHNRGVRPSPWAETRYEHLAGREMFLWVRRIAAGGGLTPQVHDELLKLVQDNFNMRRWWRRDGSHYYGSEVRATSASA